MKVWLKQLEKLIKPTKNNYCYICFQEYNKFYFNKNRFICSNCLKEMNPKFKKMMIDGMIGIGIYPYKDYIQEMLYQFKGCFDIELKRTFINHYKRILDVLFFDYVIVYVPSFISQDNERGFNHVREMFDCLSNKKIDCIEKVENIKQSSLSKTGRTNINKYLVLKENYKELENKKVLIVDDVLTTGQTLKACYNLLKTINIKKIKFLVMSYVDKCHNLNNEKHIK